ncbi:MAG: Ppx/GppA phosphatase family protein [Alcanivorax sp.]
MPETPNTYGPYGILEISSNTVHFSVTFPDNNIQSTIDEKVKCGLGNYEAGSKALNATGKEKAIEMIAAYKRNFIDPIEFTEFAAIATGALREATDAQEFLSYLKDELDIDVQVLSGEEEAYYAALGVASSFKNANGVMFDQGGRSSEFVIIQNGQLTDPVSLPLGTFAIAEQKDPEKYIKQQLEKLPDAYRSGEFETLYAVGGSPRRLLKSHKKRTDTAGKLHGYTIPVSEAATLSKDVIDASEDTLKDEFYISEKRLTLVPAAAQLVSQLSENLNIQKITASKHGLRHGLLHEMISQPQPDADEHSFEPNLHPQVVNG